MTAYGKAVRADQVRQTLESNHLRLSSHGLTPESPGKMARSVGVHLHWEYSPPFALTERECDEVQQLLRNAVIDSLPAIRDAVRAKHRKKLDALCLSARREAEAILAIPQGDAP